MLGLKGLPATSGGIERHVQEIGQRLVAKGHRVIVFCRPHYTQRTDNYLGMELVRLPSLPSKHLDAITHTTLASIMVNYHIDIVHYHAIGPSLVSFLARMKNKRVVTTVHSLDWQREKWNWLARLPLRLGEWTATHFAHSTIAVSRGLKKYLEDRYLKPVTYIPNGFSEPDPRKPSLIRELGLNGNDYALFVGRLTPEKGIHHLLAAHKAWTDAPVLVIAGGEQFGDTYTKRLRQEAGRNVIFTGEISGPLLAELYTNARLFVLPSDLEGYPIVLLEAMSYGLPIITSDIDPNREAMGNAGELFPPADTEALNRRLISLWSDETRRNELSLFAIQRAAQEYSWNITTGKLEEVYYQTMDCVFSNTID